MTELIGCERFSYQMLSRLQHDCEVVLSSKEPNIKRLWAQNCDEQIRLMRELYDSLPVKPTWLTKEDIDGFETQMNAVFARAEAF